MSAQLPLRGARDAGGGRERNEPSKEPLSQSQRSLTALHLPAREPCPTSSHANIIRRDEHTFWLLQQQHSQRAVDLRV